MVIIEYSLLWMYVLFIGFFFYASAIQSWRKLKIGIKIIIAPMICLFGLIDALFDLVIGSIIFVELPFIHGITFSQRCCYHLNDNGFRGKIAGAFSVPLNAILPEHIH